MVGESAAYKAQRAFRGYISREKTGFQKYDEDKDEMVDASAAEWLTEIWFKFGIGADIPLSDSMYLRPMFLYGFGTLSKYHKEYSDDMNKDKKQANIINHGLDFSLSLGFRF